MNDPTERKITRIARECQKLVIHRMRVSGIGSGEMDLIHLVRHHPGITQKQVSMELNMDKGAVARRVKNLEAKGYLIRTKNPDDARSVILKATPAAEDLKMSKKEVETEFYSWLMEGMEEEEKRAFLNTLNTLYWKSRKESRSGFPHIKKDEDHEAE